MTLGRAWLPAAMFLLMAWLAGSAIALAEPHVTDPEGDAREWDSAQVAKYGAMRTCSAAFTLTWPYCYAAAGAVPAAGGIPAPPALDALSASFAETPTHLLVEMQIAGLSEDPGSARTLASDRSVLWAVCWSECNEFAAIGARLGDEGWIFDGSYLYLYQDVPYEYEDDGCNFWWLCIWSVPVEVEFGEPATLRWSIPRDALRDGIQGAMLTDPSVFTMRSGTAGTPELRWGLGNPTQARGNLGSMYLNLVDTSLPGHSFVFESGLEPLSRVPSLTLEDPHGDVHGDAASPETDILAFRFEEHPDALRFEVDLAEVAERPIDHGLLIWLSTPSGRVYEFGYGAHEGEREPHGGHPTDWLYSSWVGIPVTLEIETGAPGTITIVVERRYLEPLAAGDPLLLLMSETTVRARIEQPLGPAGDAEAYRVQDMDPGPLASPYRFHYDSSPLNADGALFIEDPVGDVSRGPDPLGQTRPEQFDLTYVRVEGRDESATTVTLGLRDLASVRVPIGHTAILYAAGFQIGQTSFMAGYYKSDQKQEFFCAQDTAVLTETRRDPNEVVWQTIDGMVSVAGAGGGGSGSPGSITLTVPHSCFGTDARGTLFADRAAAGTYLLRQTQAGIVEVASMDEVAAPQGAMLGRSPPEALVPAWYVAPFGFPNFWDMLGIGLALAFATGAGALKVRQRRRDRRAVAAAKLREDRDVYRDALAKAVARGDADPGSDEVLQALRRRLGVGEREHAVMLLQARAATGLGSGLAKGERFLDRYRIEGVLGAGGFARTFLARDEKLGRRVVLKVQRLDDPREAERALKEGRTLARLGDPNIVAIHDVEEVASEVVLVLEHMARGSLADLLARSRITQVEALALADDVLSALEAAHAKGVVHRDVKPANVLLAANGRAKLADFGIARRARGAGTATDLSLGGHGAGTLRYMSPEQARGAPADARSDLYAVGAMLYEMLAGRPYLALDGLSEYDARTAILEEAPLLPLQGVSKELNVLLTRAVEKDRAERPQSAAEMRRMLRLVGASVGDAPRRATAVRD